jgi:hypothetical protein
MITIMKSWLSSRELSRRKRKRQLNNRGSMMMKRND